LDKLVYGIGVNDADYVISGQTVIGRDLCPYYAKWHDMLKRCYSDKYQEKQTRYIGCTVCEDWLTFSNFRSWMKKQDWYGKEIDKDIIKIGNKIYSPENCCFVDESINSLLVSCNSKRGNYPQGVNLDKQTGKYRSQISINGKQKSLGRYDTPEEASRVYNNAKGNHLINIANEQDNERIKNGLLKHSKIYFDNK